MTLRAAMTALALIVASTASPQEPPPPAPAPDRTFSLGQPPIIRGVGFLSAGTWSRGDETLATGYLHLSGYKDFVNPAVAALRLGFGGYVGLRDDDIDGGLRASFYVPILRLALGYDFNFKDEEADFVLSLIHPIRRGGIFGHGTQLRADWIPGRGHSFNFGVTFPLRDLQQGRTRASRNYVRLPNAPRGKTTVDPGHSAALTDALNNVAESARWVSRLTTPYLDHDGNTREVAIQATRASLQQTRAHLARPSPLGGKRTSRGEVEIFHRELERAFTLATGGEGSAPGQSDATGRRLATLARAALLDEVLIPYDRLLGQKKKNDTTRGLALRAREAFGVGLVGMPDLAPAARDGASAVFDRLLAVVEAMRAETRKRWEDDPRLVWLPLQLGLLPEQHDEREEMNAVVQRVVGGSFVPGNRIWYAPNEQFTREMAQMIRRAEDYHVLWIHDFRSVDGAGHPDDITHLFLTRVYLETLKDRVRAYDQAGRFPTYLILQDQFFYELNKSRHVHDVLEDPLHAKVPKYPKGYEYMARDVEKALTELREAVAGSRRLQEDARRHGEDWLEQTIKVHINITNPADPTYWTREMLPIVGVLDTLMRDHRKIAFYDLTDQDPYKGMAIYSGMGIGEHYTGATWEDRAVLAQGPALLTLRDAARTVLLEQGLAPSRIPPPLRAGTKAADYDAKVAAAIADGSAIARLLDIHNRNGFGDKPVTVFKAALYELAPPGAVTVVPDHLWNNPLWGGMLAAQSLRGGRTFVISPSRAAHPGAASGPVASRTQELFERLILFQQNLGEEITASGGVFKTGFYDVRIDVKDLPGRAKLALGNIRDTPFLHDLFRFDAAMDGVLERLEPEFSAYRAKYLFGDASKRQPTLHLKINYMASREGWGVIGQPEMAAVLEEQIRRRLAQLADAVEYVDVRNVAEPVREQAMPVVQGYLQGLDEEARDRAMAFLTVGSHNQDLRAMILDGEVALTVSGVGSLAALTDVVFLMGSATWVDTLEELEPMYPRYKERTRKIGRFIRVAI